MEKEKKIPPKPKMLVGQLDNKSGPPLRDYSVYKLCDRND